MIKNFASKVDYYKVYDTYDSNMHGVSSNSVSLIASMDSTKVHEK